jgi:hypothetical protein
VLILKEVKVVCFDTLSQVLILKEMEERSTISKKGDEIGSPSRRVSPEGGMPPPVFCKKRLQAIENKGRELQKERQESSRGCKLLKGRELVLE